MPPAKARLSPRVLASGLSTEAGPWQLNVPASKAEAACSSRASLCKSEYHCPHRQGQKSHRPGQIPVMETQTPLLMEQCQGICSHFLKTAMLNNLNL